MRACLFPGSFDPPTNGHLDIARRLSGLFDEVYVCVMCNGEKRPFLPEETRVELLKDALSGLPNVQVVLGEGFTVHMARKLNACAIARGIRDEQDFVYESRLVRANAYVDEGIETVFLPARPEHGGLSSSVVREIWGLSGDISALVPENVQKALEKMRRRES